MSKTKAKRTVSCGGCGEDGHNTRTCPVRTGPVVEEAATVAAPVAVATSAPVAKVETPAPPVPIKTKIDMREHPPARPRREAPTADRGTAATAAPYRCVKCNSVAILAIVRVTNHVETQRLGRTIFKGDLRCEQCLNKPDPAMLILKWGVMPGATITEEEANAKP